MLKRFEYSLGFKFSLAMGGLLLLVCVMLSISLYYYLRQQAVQDAKDKTQIIMSHTKALGGYVRDTLRPKMYQLLRESKSEEEFVIEAMSTTHVTQQVMRRFNKDLPEYQFRRTSDSPLNPANKANDFESRMIRHFSENPRVPLWQGIETAGGRDMLMSVRPVISDVSCLWCHGSSAAIPKTVRKLYGDGSMFGWKADAVVGVESVAIPLDVAFAQVRKFAFDTFLFGILALTALFAGLYVTFRQLVTGPLYKLSRTFRNIADGKEPLSRERPADRSDEIGKLTASFNLLAQHLHDAQEKVRAAAALEKQMMQTEKLAALGQLSAGVAHEINNPLGGIKLCFNNLLKTPMDEQAREEHIRLVSDGLDRIQTIIRQLLDYSKNAPLMMQRVSLKDIVQNVLQLADYMIEKKGIHLRAELAADLPNILADANKLEQVFLNIILNAIHAVQPGGSITVTFLREDSFCVVSVADTGPGIPPTILEHIFDPFFTTKEVGEGTGIGLTVSKAIIEQHHGTIWVKTSSEGTVFLVKLPMAL